jgi:membrane protease YdiL (CAAX protease family)
VPSKLYTGSDSGRDWGDLENRLDSRFSDLAEITVGYALILATIWSARPARVYFGWLAISWTAVALTIGARRSGSFGLGWRGFRESLWAVGLAFTGVVIVVLCASAFGTLHYNLIEQPLHLPMIGYFVWSFVQQLILQNLFLSRLLRLLGRPTLAMWVAGLMLSMAHLPNLLLVGATLFWGVGACWLFMHYRSLYAVGLIHFLFGLSLAVGLPSSLNHNMRVGRGYAHYREITGLTPNATSPGVSLPQPQAK